MDRIVVHTDGACWPNNGRGTGGWAFVAEWGVRRVTRHGFERPSTNNRMELMAVVRALQYVRLTAHPLVVRTDSMYVFNALTAWGARWRRFGWRTSAGEPVKNRELIEPALALIERHRTVRQIDLEWVKGHAGDKGNEHADRLSVIARQQCTTTWTENCARVDVG